MDSDSSRRSKRASKRASRVSNQDYPSLPGTVLFSAGAIRGSGILLDISATGANVYQPSKNLPKGVVADLYFLQPNTGRRLHAEAEVVRRTESGFAVRFRRVERELEALVVAADAGDAGDAGDAEDA
jgi:hypothetical protein